MRGIMHELLPSQHPELARVISAVGDYVGTVFSVKTEEHLFEVVEHLSNTN